MDQDDGFEKELRGEWLGLTDKSLGEITDLHRKHSPRRVTREEIENILYRVASQGNYPNWEWWVPTSKVIDDLLALFERKREKAEWCEHIKWNPATDRWEMNRGQGWVHCVYNDDAEVWDICPVKRCHAKKP